MGKYSNSILPEFTWKAMPSIRSVAENSRLLGNHVALLGEWFLTLEAL
jgi:hypothetical protein